MDREKQLYVFIHGAYQSPWMWIPIIDEMAHRIGEINYLLISLPGYTDNDSLNNSLSKSIEKIKTVVETKELVIVGHSLGASYACILVSLLQIDNNIRLYLSCMPIAIPTVYITLRLFFEKILRRSFIYIPIQYIPVFFRSKIITNYSENNILMILLKHSNYIDFLLKSKNLKKIYLGSSHMDFIVGSIKHQYNLVEELNKNSMVTSFTSFGIMGHYPYRLNRKKYIDWLLIDKKVKI